MSLIDLYTKNDANPDARATPSVTAHQLFEAARRDWLASRQTLGAEFDAVFNSYVARRGGLSEADERTLAMEAADLFRQKREASEKAAVRANELAAERQHAARVAMGAESTRATWVEKTLATFFRAAADLRAMADDMDAAKGTRSVSVFMPGQPAIASDAEIIALCERIGQRLNAAGAVVKLTGNDAVARMRMETNK